MLISVPLGIVLLVCGVFGNGFLLLVLGTQRSMWKVHNIFIANLTFADLLVVCAGLPFQVLDLLLGVHPVVNILHCQINAFVTCFGFGISVMSLICVSFNRYVKVCHTRYFDRIFSVRKNAALCGVIWVVTLGLLVPLLYGDTKVGYDSRSHTCSVYEKKAVVNYRSIVMLGLLVFPPAAIGFFNFKIFQLWKKTRKRSHGGLTARKSVHPTGSPSVAVSLDGQGSSLEQFSLASMDTQATLGSKSEVMLLTSGGEQTPENVGTSEAGTFSEGKVEKNPEAGERSGSQGTPLCNRKIPSFTDLKDEVSTSCASNSVTTSESPRVTPSGKYSKTLNQQEKDYLSRVRAHAKKAMKVKSYRGEIALVRSLLTVAVCLFVLYLPYAICLVLNLFIRVPTEVMILSIMFLFANCSINWIIYGAMNTSFRKAYVSTLVGCCLCFYRRRLRLRLRLRPQFRPAQDDAESSATASRSVVFYNESSMTVNNQS